MLRNRPDFLTLIACLSLSLFINTRTGYAQGDEFAAPWRLESFDPGEFEIPDSISIDEFDSSAWTSSVIHDSTSYNLRITLKYQQAILGKNQSIRPYRFGPKFSMAGSDQVFLGLALEKDPGEAHFWDHSALTASLPLPNNIGKIILGDYLVGYGCGLVIRTARNWGLGRDIRSNLQFRAQGVKPYNGWGEDLALRGAAIELSRDDSYLSFWGSSRERGVILDTNDVIQSFSSSSNTSSREEGWGARFNHRFLSRYMTIGLAYSATNWDRKQHLSSTPSNRNGVGGLDLFWSDDSLAVMAETAWDDHGDQATMAKLDWRLNHFRIQQAIYSLDPNYSAPMASSFDMGPGEVANRQGSYSGLAYRIRGTALSGFMHLYRYPYRSVGQSWGGEDVCLSVEETSVRRARFVLVSRWLQEQESDTLIQIQRWRGSGLAAFNPSADWKLTAVINLCSSEMSNELGQMLRLEMSRIIRIDLTAGLTFSLGAGIYQAQDYSVRLYWNEAEPSASYRVRPLWGRGEAAQICINGWRNHWGQVDLSWWYDQPEPESARKCTKEISVTYRYP
jgi:hypothetical protein